MSEPIKEKWSVSMRNDIPEGFDGVYRCKAHPERDAVAPIALRKCTACLELARDNYAQLHAFSPSYRFQDELSPDGRSIYGEMTGRYRPAKEKIL